MRKKQSNRKKNRLAEPEKPRTADSAVRIAPPSQRSQAARERALHAISAMRRDPKLSLTHAAKLQGVKPSTIWRHFPSALKKSDGRIRAIKGDRYKVTLQVPDAQGHSIAVTTRSSKDRAALSQYLRDLGRHLRGKRDALAPWRGKKIGGVELVTDGRILASIEPALSEFSLYRATNGGAA